MSAATVSRRRTPTPEQQARLPAMPALAAPITVPLSAVSITFARSPHFSGEDTQPVTITGADLAAVLDWLPSAGPGTTFGNADDIALVIEGLSDALCALSNTDVDEGGALWALGVVLRDYARRIVSPSDAARCARDLVTIAPVTTDAAQ